MFEIEGKHISVIGAARSGVAVATLLKRKGAHVFVSDKAPMEKVAKEYALLQEAGIPLETGGHSKKVFDCSLMVISPGVPSDAPVVAEAQKRSIPVVSELEVASWFCPAPIIAITGSNGKTTTTTLTGKIISDAKKKCIVAGNIGTAFSSVVDDADDETIVVLEVSSFQLDHIKTFRPKVSVILNIAPDHMDRYEHSMEKYSASKARVFENQKQDDAFIYNTDDEWTQRIVPAAHCRTIGFSTKSELAEGVYLDNGIIRASFNGTRQDVIEVKELGIKGIHNVYNAMAAVAATMVMGIEINTIYETLRSFQGVEHRLEFVRVHNGVRYYNDSKATNVDSVWYALLAFDEPIVLIIGGRDKGNDYSRLTELVQKKVKAIVAIGESADKVEKAFTGITVVKSATSMEEAVSVAKFLAVPGEIVLLSPACASFDWFENYEHRGQVFKQIVNEL